MVIFFSMDIIRLRALCCSATSVSAVYRYTMGTPTKLAWAMFWWGEAEVTVRFMLQRNIRQRGLPMAFCKVKIIKKAKNSGFMT